MENLTLHFKEDDRQPTFAARVAELFQSRPGCWIDGRELATIAGCYGWRTRVSDCRRSPFNLTIRNRQRRIRKTDGGSYVVSEYRLESEVRPGEGAADDAPTSPAAA